LAEDLSVSLNRFYNSIMVQWEQLLGHVDDLPKQRFGFREFALHSQEVSSRVRPSQVKLTFGFITLSHWLWHLKWLAGLGGTSPFSLATFSFATARTNFATLLESLNSLLIPLGIPH